MDVTLSSEQKELAEVARAVLAKECPISLVREVALPGGTGHSAKLWRSIADAGWLGIPFPAHLGGSDATLVELGLIFREMGRVIAPTTFSSTIHAALLLHRLGSDDQIASWLPRVIAGEVVATVAFAEPSVEHSVRHLETAAYADDGGWVLTGRKAYVRNAAQADLILVAALVKRKDLPSRLGYFLVEPAASDAIEIASHHTFAHDAQHELHLDGLRLPASALVGGLGSLDDNEAGHTQVLEAATALQCMEIYGGAEKVLELICGHVTEREQFGRALGSFQAVQHIVANLASEIYGGRLAVLRALWMVASGRKASREVSIAKAWLSRAYVNVTVWAHQLHGGMGYARETDLHLWSERAKTLEAENGGFSYHLTALEEHVVKIPAQRPGPCLAERQLSALAGPRLGGLS